MIRVLPYLALSVLSCVPTLAVAYTFLAVA